MIRDSASVASKSADPAEALLIWQRSLSDEIVRSLASEFMRGIREPEAIDGYAEYVRRYGDPKHPVYSKKNGRAKNKR